MALQTHGVLAALLAFGLAGSAAQATSASPTNAGYISAQLTSADGTDVGTVTFRSIRAGVLVTVDLTDLPSGDRAIHIHETGACTPDFEAAGEHLAPDGHEHGFAQTETPHMGDLPNIYVDDDGLAQAEFVNWRLTLDDLLDADGSAVVVHETRDTYMDPGSAGGRIACGVVEQHS
jgi:Cu-Zn family superoxide dismutase